MPQETLHLQTLAVDGRPVGVLTLWVRETPALAASNRLPVILLHGLGCSSDAWQPSLRAMAALGVDCPVYVPDMPGFGCSPGPPKSLGIAELADWVVRLMDVLGLPRVHLAGNSLGGQVALAVARRHPARVGRIVLVGSTVGGHPIPFWRYAAGLLRDGVREPLRYNIVLARMYAQMGLPRYLATTRQMLADEPLAYACEVQTPCLVLRGEHDGIIPDATARRLAAALPRAQFRRLRGTAHALQFSRPREFAEIALSFWAGHTEESSGD